MSNSIYTKISKVYDNNPIRSSYIAEPLIEQLLSNNKGSIKVLDLACGTGTYLNIQLNAFNDSRISWYGCDLSQDMLSVAKEKLPSSVELMISNANKLPYSDRFFNFISCNFAFHHFNDKKQCIKEINRILKPSGIFLMRNICPESMPLSWVYHYFKGTRQIDNTRFWSNRQIYNELLNIGFKATITTTITYKEYLILELITESINRDMSQLNIINDRQYNNGIKKMENDNKNSSAYTGNFALMQCEAIKTI